jgi:phosphatidylserine decarboxylase
MSEAVKQNPNVYPDFNSFFTRALRPEVRPVVQEPGQICCPADSAISQLGAIQGSTIFQAKGHSYSLLELLGGSEERARPFIDGQFVTMYLSPGDYHRVHMPFTGRLLETVYIPGRLFSVSPDFTESVPRLFARNERVVCVFDTAVGPMVVILVGAIFVGSIETVWAGEITPPRSQQITVTRNDNINKNIIQLEKGAELGRFNMGGSTIIVFFGPDRAKWQSELVAETRVQFGQLLGNVLNM